MLKPMNFDMRALGSTGAAAALALAALLTLAGCETPPTAAPTARDIRGLKPSGAVTMSQVFLSGSGVGSGTLTFQGRAYRFTLIGSVTGLGALSGFNAAGEVYNLHDPSQFSGAYFQGADRLAVSLSATGDLWLKNNHGVIMRLTAVQTGLTLTTGRYQLFIELAK
jgi:hypothetical protein